jgi:hypothetical protein
MIIDFFDELFIIKIHVAFYLNDIGDTGTGNTKVTAVETES